MSTTDDPIELPLLLLGGFRSLIDELHARLGREGHPQVRPIHGFALQALGPDGAGASELGRRLGVSKQAAAKTAGALEELGYVERRADPADARGRVLIPTDRGLDLIRRSGRILAELESEWRQRVGDEQLAALITTLRALDGQGTPRLDAPGWFGAHR